jgi:Mg2+-importing ATPase
LPVEKTDAPDRRENISSIERTNLCFLGTSVESGSATAVVVATGHHTYFGHVAHGLMRRQVETAFDKGLKKFTWLMIRFMAVMVPLVFLINGITKHDWKEAFFLRSPSQSG